MRHLFIGESDYAASGNMFSLALGTTGEETRCLIGRRHLFQYPQQGEIGRCAEDWRLGVEWADWIWVIQTDLPLSMGGTYGSVHKKTLRDIWLERLKGKQIVLLHGGGQYRDNREFYRELWSPFNPISICYEADLMGSFENEHLVIPPVNMKWFERKKRHWTTLRVGHFPSRPTDKGSEWIVPLLGGVENIQFRTSVVNPFDDENGSIRVPWVDHLDRMSDCDVIVDQIKPELKGRPFGEWVSIGTEAAALGCISIANSLNQEPYKKTYGRYPGIHVCNDPTDLVKEIERIKTLPPYELEREKQESREWVEQYHSLEPTGKILKRLCELQ